jgi:hypothetical protein
MKTFQKIALVSAIAAAPFAAQAELKAMDDALMGETTGHAGVTVEIDIAAGGVTIGEVEYIDTAGGTIGGGSVLLQNINISNADITQTIDVDADGSLVLGVSAIDNLTLTLGNFDGTDADKSAVALKSQALSVTEVVNGVSMVVDMGESSTTLVNMAQSGAAGKYTLNGIGFDNGTDLASNAADGSLAIVMDQKVYIQDLDVQMFGYTEAQSTAKVASLNTDIIANDADSANALALYNQSLVAGGGTAYADVAAYIADTDKAAENGQATAAIAGGSAIQISDVKFYDADLGDGNGVAVKQTVWAQGGSIANGGGVYIAMGDMKGTLEIGGITMGGTSSIGSVKISNIDLSGMTQRIYGHP